MRLFPLCLLLGLAACDMAGPGFHGAPKLVREVEGSRFTLRFQGDLVEAIRTSPEMLPRFDAVARKAGIAAQMESGCTASWVEGDPSMMWIGLSCDGKAAPKMPRRPRTLFCDLTVVSPESGNLPASVACR
jgi:hypothetical protein